MLRIAGDINFTDGFFDTGFGTGSSIKKKADPFGNLRRAKDDFWIGNLECVCASHSDKTGLHGKQFIIAPQSLSHIRHFDLYGVANNHVMQHGGEAYREMLGYLQGAGVGYVGSLDRKHCVFEHQGKQVGILAFSQRPDHFSATPLYWSLPEYRDVQAEIESLSGCDFRIAYVHWGNEFIDRPYRDQIQFAHWMVDCGIDLVVGMHPHVLQGYEVYNEKHIFYSLGNFVFHMPWEPTKYAAIINVDLAHGNQITYDYVRIGTDYFPAYTDTVPWAYRFETLNGRIPHDDENEVYYARLFVKMKSYRRANSLHLVRNIFRFRLSDLLGIAGDFLKRRLKR